MCNIAAGQGVRTLSCGMLSNAQRLAECRLRVVSSCPVVYYDAARQIRICSKKDRFWTQSKRSQERLQDLTKLRHGTNVK